MKNTYDAPKASVISLISESAICVSEDFVNGNETPEFSFPFFEEENN